MVAAVLIALFLSFVVTKSSESVAGSYVPKWPGFQLRHEFVEHVMGAFGVSIKDINHPVPVVSGLGRVRMVDSSWITEEVTKRRVVVAIRTERTPDPDMDKGSTRVISQGREGLVEQTVVVRRKGARVIGEEIIQQRELVKPQPRVVAVGTREPVRVLMTSRGSFRYRKVLTMVATAYEPSERSCGKWADGYTAIGMKAQPGVVAVDPKVIPLRTRLYVEGYGPALAADVGGAIKGNRIDLFFETVKEALDYGRRRVKVYILED